MLINLSRSPPEKILERPPTTPSEIASFWTSLPSEFSLPSVGGRGMDIFWNYTIVFFNLTSLFTPAMQNLESYGPDRQFYCFTSNGRTLSEIIQRSGQNTIIHLFVLFIVELPRAKRARRSPIAKIHWQPRKARKFDYDVAYARTTVRTLITCKPMPNVRLFWRESVWPAESCLDETTKESIKMKTVSGKCFCIRVV